MLRPSVAIAKKSKRMVRRLPVVAFSISNSKSLGKGVSIHQIERATGISRGVIAKS